MSTGPNSQNIRPPPNNTLKDHWRNQPTMQNQQNRPNNAPQKGPWQPRMQNPGSRPPNSGARAVHNITTNDFGDPIKDEMWAIPPSPLKEQVEMLVA